MHPDEFTAVLSTVRAFLDSEVRPAEDAIERDDAVPDTLRTKAAAMGLFGFAIPASYGGLGLTMAEEVRLAFELGRVSLAFRSLFGTNNGIAGQALLHHGTEEQRRHWLPQLASGAAIASFCLTEEGAGSDPAALQTTATPTSSGGFTLDGAKRFITNAPHAGLFVVFARAPRTTGPDGLSVYLVPADTPGITVGPPDAKMGQAGAHTAEVHFTGAAIGPEGLLGGPAAEGAGFRAAMGALRRGRLHLAAISVGLAQRALDESTAHAAHRIQSGRPIGEHQLVQAMLADSYTEIAAGRALTLSAADRYDDGTDTKVGPSAAKYYCSEMAGRVADRAVQIHGGSGYMRGVPVERLYRDARLLRLYEGTSEIQQGVIGRALIAQGQARHA
ncbi:acyl-CoA dehydrogenase family protein [Nocardiopsis coralliicola]